jgi:hypothetical protein
VKKNLATANPDKNGDFVVQDKLLYKVYHGVHKARERLPNLALIIPKSLILSICVNTHQELGHAGKDRMLAALLPKVYWKGMQNQIACFVRGCRTCTFRHLSERKRKPIRIAPPLKPGKRIAVDVWTGGGGKLLTAMCLHSMYPFAKAIPDKSAESVNEALQEILAEIGGDPVEILTDNGAEFTNGDWKKLLASRRIAHRLSAPYTPRTNGVLERFHRFLNEQLRISLHFNHNNDYWPCVRAALEAYRRTPHCSTGETPQFLFNGREPTYAIDHMLPTLGREMWNEDENRLDLSQLRIAFGLARKNACLARLKNKFVCKQGEEVIKVGDRVYLRNLGKKAKLDLRWLAGYRVVEMLTGRTVRIEKTRTGEKTRVGLQHLRKADPLSELLGNSNVDVFPGRSKLYLHAGDLKNLDWPAATEVSPLDEDTANRAEEAARNRYGDRDQQPVREHVDAESLIPKVSKYPEGKPSKRSRRAARLANTDNDGTDNVAARSDKPSRPHRLRRRPGWFDHYVVAAFTHGLQPGDREAKLVFQDHERGVDVFHVTCTDETDGARKDVDLNRMCSATGHESWTYQRTRRRAALTKLQDTVFQDAMGPSFDVNPVTVDPSLVYPFEH